MREFFFENFEHALCLLILLGRVGDVVSTYLLTPTLKLEGNLVAKKLGWKFAWLTLLVCLVPYYSPVLGVVVLVPSLLVSASNIGKIWFARSYGEKRLENLLLSLARSGRPASAILPVVFSSGFIVLAGVVLWLLSPDPDRDWGHWFAWGIISYGAVILLHGSLWYRRLFKRARLPQNGEAVSPGPVP